MRWKLLSSSPHGLAPRYLERGLPWLAQACASGAVAWIIAQSFWGLVAPGRVAPTTKASPTLQEQSHRVKARHFFDVVSVQQPSSDADEVPASGMTDIRWRLLGTYVDAGTGSRAVLTMEGGLEVIVARVGDQLPSGHEVVEVRLDSVVLSKDGQRGELALRPEAGGAQDQGPPEDRFGPIDQTPFNKDSR